MSEYTPVALVYNLKLLVSEYTPVALVYNLKLLVSEYTPVALVYNLKLLVSEYTPVALVYNLSCLSWVDIKAVCCHYKRANRGFPARMVYLKYDI